MRALFRPKRLLPDVATLLRVKGKQPWMVLWDNEAEPIPILSRKFKLVGAEIGLSSGVRATLTANDADAGSADGEVSASS